MTLGDVFVVGGAGCEAAVQDADQAVAELAQGGAVADAAARELVVVAAGAGRATQRGEGLQAEGVDEPIVVHVAGHDDLLLARLTGDGAGAGVVLAGTGVAVAGLAVAELGKHPSARTTPRPGWLR
jgi:hypothetical protein